MANRSSVEPSLVIAAFYDLRGFTKLVKDHGPSVVIDIIRGAHARLTRSISGQGLAARPVWTRGGWYFKLLGDGLMVVRPLEPRPDRGGVTRAHRDREMVERFLILVRAAAELEQRLAYDLRRAAIARRVAQGIDRPRVGAGLSVGLALPVPSPRTPQDWIGEPVNLASRLQAQADPFGIVADARQLSPEVFERFTDSPLGRRFPVIEWFRPRAGTTEDTEVRGYERKIRVFRLVPSAQRQLLLRPLGQQASATELLRRYAPRGAARRGLRLPFRLLMAGGEPPRMRQRRRRPATTGRESFLARHPAEHVRRLWDEVAAANRLATGPDSYDGPAARVERVGARRRTILWIPSRYDWSRGNQFEPDSLVWDPSGTVRALYEDGILTGGRARASCPQPRARSLLANHLGVTAQVYLVDGEDDWRVCVLPLMRRALGLATAAQQLGPTASGTVEPDDLRGADAAAAARRELKRETGLAKERLEFLGVTGEYRRMGHPDCHWAARCTARAQNLGAEVKRLYDALARAQYAEAEESGHGQFALLLLVRDERGTRVALGPGQTRVDAALDKLEQAAGGGWKPAALEASAEFWRRLEASRPLLGGDAVLDLLGWLRDDPAVAPATVACLALLFSRLGLVAIDSRRTDVLVVTQRR